MSKLILTPKTLWKDFDDTLPLKESVLSTNAVNGVNINSVYFSGRSVGNERVRIYGIYAKNVIKSKGSILIIPDVNEQVDYELILKYAQNGYDVLSVDLQGVVDGKKDYTKYPESVDYANYEKSYDRMWRVDETAKKTSWYEWVSVCRYALSYLKNKNPNNKIGLLGIKYGSLIAFMLSAIDKKVDCSCNLFGGGWLAYKGISKFSNEEFEINEERRRFLAGIEVQAYAQFVTCPVLFLGCTNSIDFDLERSMDTLMRIQNQEDLRFNFVTYANSVLDSHSYNDTAIFFDRFLSSEKVYYTQRPQLKVELEGKDVYYTVDNVDNKNLVSLSVLCAKYNVNPTERVWYDVDTLVSKTDSEFVFKRPNYDNFEKDISFVVARYKNGLTISSKLNYFEVNSDLTVNMPSIIYSTQNLKTNFIVQHIKTPLLGGVFAIKDLIFVDDGPFKIDGLFTKNTLQSYKIKEISNSLSSSSSFKFDFYSSMLTDLVVTIKDNNGVEFVAVRKIDGGEFWNNVLIDFNEFKTKEGLSISDYSSICVVEISSTGEFAINNFLLLN